MFEWFINWMDNLDGNNESHELDNILAPLTKIKNKLAAYSTKLDDNQTIEHENIERANKRLAELKVNKDLALKRFNKINNLLGDDD